MAVAQGFGKTLSKNLIFGYDIGDTRNSFRGAPGTNIAVGPNRNYSGISVSNYDGGRLFATNGYTETVYIPTLGFRSVESVEVYNVYTGYGDGGNYNCCPNLFNYAGGQEFTGGTTYTYQIIYKCESGYTNPNYMYHYEYGPSGYITEFGVHTESQRTHLGDGWYHAWATFTTDPRTTSGYKGLWYYNYNTRDKVSIAAISIVPGTSVRPPSQFIDENSTRTSTQALIDLAGLNSIEVNCSFGSIGELIFDGTDDRLIVRPNQTHSIGNYAMEVVFSASALPSKRHYLIDPRGDGSENNSPMYFLFDDNGSQIRVVGGNSNIEVSSGWISIQTNKFYHLVCTRTAATCTLYLNGTEIGSANTGTETLTISNPFRIGTYSAASSGQYFLNGKIAVARIYSRGMTQSDVNQNYSHYKTRFNL